MRLLVALGLRDMCLLFGEEFYSAWGDFRHAITTGKSSFERVHGMSANSYFSQDDDAARRFQATLTTDTTFFDHLPEVFDFPEHSMIVDLGGGNGHLLSSVLRAVPTARGMLTEVKRFSYTGRGLEGCPDGGGVGCSECVESLL